MFSGNTSALTWLDRDNVLMDQRYLFHLPAENFVWKYSAVDGSMTPRGLTQLVSDGDHAQLIAYELPHPAAKEAIAALGAAPQAVLIDASTATQVLVDAPPDAYDILEKIAADVGKRSRWNIQPKAEVSLIARVQQTDDPVEINVRYMTTQPISTGGGSPFGGPSFGGPSFGGGMFGSGMFPPGFGGSRFGGSGFGPSITPRMIVPSNRPVRTLSVRPYFGEFELRRDGETLWSWRNVLKAGATFTAQEGDSDSEIIDRVIQPNYDALRAVYIPRKIVNETEAFDVGSSTLSPDGIAN